MDSGGGCGPPRCHDHLAQHRGGGRVRDVGDGRRRKRRGRPGAGAGAAGGGERIGVPQVSGRGDRAGRGGFDSAREGGGLATHHPVRYYVRQSSSAVAHRGSVNHRDHDHDHGGGPRLAHDECGMAQSPRDCRTDLSDHGSWNRPTSRRSPRRRRRSDEEDEAVEARRERVGEPVED